MGNPKNGNLTLGGDASQVVYAIALSKKQKQVNIYASHHHVVEPSRQTHHPPNKTILHHST